MHRRRFYDPLLACVWFIACVFALGVSGCANPFVTPVTTAVTDITLNKTSLTLAPGETDTLVATVKPISARDKTVQWSSDSASATVSASGLVTAVSPGSATITATSHDSSFTATCAVTVYGVSLNKTSSTIATGSSETLVATVHLSDGQNHTLAWASSDEDVVQVSDGLVIGLAEGQATITVTVVGGSFSASCVVSVSGTLNHTYAEILPAINALHAGLMAASQTTNSAEKAYYTVTYTPEITMTCHLNRYQSGGYVLTGSITIDYDANYVPGAMNGTVAFTGGIVSRLSCHETILSVPRSGTVDIAFSDGTSGTIDLAAGKYTQN